jgi:hypothetical protein
MEKLNHLQFNFENYLICPKCNLIIENPYELECCGVLYCYNCIKYNHTDKDICPNCCKISLFRQNSFVKRISNQMVLYCTFNCGARFPFTEIRHHMSSCSNREYICNLCIKNGTASDSNFKGKKKEFLAHMVDVHEKDIFMINDRHKEINNYIENKREEEKKSNIHRNKNSMNENEIRNSLYYNEEDNSSYESDLNENYSEYASGDNWRY